MRVRRRLDLHREDGAVLAIVALLMTAIFGMVALTVDVGGLLSLRRQMVTAADSAALAAAQACATDEGASAALTSADYYASQNVATAAQTEFTLGPNGSECGTGSSGRVTVGYESLKDLFFAPILGFDDFAQIEARAAATWGPAAAARPIPVTISEDWLSNECRIDELNLDQQIECLWDNETFTPSSWGGLDLDAWNVAGGPRCDGIGADKQKGWMSQGGYHEPRSVNDSAPTWVCGTTGLRDSVVKALDEYAKANPDNLLYLPINRGWVMGNDNQIDKFNIVGFLGVRVIQAAHVSPPSIHGECKAKSVGPVTTGDEMFLDDLVKTCTGTSYQAPFSHIGIQQVKELDEQGEPRAGTENTWSFSEATRIFTWTGDDAEHGLYIEFDFSRTGVAACGSQTTSSASAYCITFQWRGIQLVPGEVIECNGALGACMSNVRAIRLIE